MAGPVKSQFEIESPDQSSPGGFSIDDGTPASAPAETAAPTPPEEKFGSGTPVENTLGREITSTASAMNPYGIAKGIYHNFADAPTTPEEKSAAGPTGQYGLGLYRTIAQPLSTAAQYYGTLLKHPETRQNAVDDALSVAPEAIGQGAGTVLGGKMLEGTTGAAKGAINGLGEIKEAVQNKALGNPDVAAAKALNIPAKSPKMQSTLRDVQGARPYLQGATNLTDLQSKIPIAKSEIWKPYQEAIQKIGDKPIQGPDGMTTAADLEKTRLETSAQLQSLRKLKPTDQQSLLQRNQGVTSLQEQYKNITNALDPELRAAGVDPEAIRNAHGSVKGVERNVSGRSSVAETPQPTGFGRVQNMSLKKPATILTEFGKGANDVVAGRPLWSAKPSDLAVREAFRRGGVKPSLTSPIPVPEEAASLPEGPANPPALPVLQRYGNGGGTVLDPDTMSTINRDIERRFGPSDKYTGINRRKSE